MKFPDVSLHEWFAMYPALQEFTPLCNCRDYHLQPYRTEKSAGITCNDCGASGWTGATPEQNEKNVLLVSGVTTVETLH